MTTSSVLATAGSDGWPIRSIVRRAGGARTPLGLVLAVSGCGVTPARFAQLLPAVSRDTMVVVVPAQLTGTPDPETGNEQTRMTTAADVIEVYRAAITACREDAAVVLVGLGEGAQLVGELLHRGWQGADRTIAHCFQSGYATRAVRAEAPLRMPVRTPIWLRNFEPAPGEPSVGLDLTPEEYAEVEREARAVRPWAQRSLVDFWSGESRARSPWPVTSTTQLGSFLARI